MLGLKATPLAWVKRLIAVAVSVVAISLVYRKVDLERLRPLFAQVHWGWMLAALAAFFPVLACGALRWDVALRLVNAGVGRAASLRAFLAGHLFNLLFFGAAGGDVAKSALYARWHHKPFYAVMAAAPLDRLVGLAGAALVWGGFLLMAWKRGTLPDLRVANLPLPQLAMLWFWAAVVVGGVTLMLALRWKLTPETGLGRFIHALTAAAARLVMTPREALTGIAAAAGVQVALCLVYACCIEAVGVEQFVWLDMLWALSVISLLAMLPSMAGLGVREGGAAVMLGLYGVPIEQAVSAALLSLLVNVLWTTAGAWALWSGNRLHAATAPRQNSGAQD